MSVAILGGGLAGLSAAMNLPETVKATLYEKENTLGGLLKTDNHENFFFDHGPHLFFHTDPYFVEVFEKAMRVGGFLKKGAKTGQHSFEKLIDFPYAMHLKSLPDHIVAECVSDFVKCQISLAAREPSTPKNYEDYCRTYFGDGFTKHFMIPYAVKIWTVHPRDLSTDWVGTRIVLPEAGEVIKGALTDRRLAGNYIKEFRYPKRGGTQSFVDGVTQMIPKNVTLRQNATVTRISLKQKVLEFEDGHKAYYEKAISTLPLPDLARLIQDLPSEIHGALERLKWFGVLLMNFAAPDIRDNEYQWIYFDQENTCFHRVHYPYKLSDAMVPAGGRSLQAEISFSKYRDLPASEDLLLERAWKELVQAGFVEGTGSPRVAKSRKLLYAYAIMDDQRAEAVSVIRAYLKSQDFLTCGRFGEWDYIWTDKVLNSGRRAAQVLYS